VIEFRSGDILHSGADALVNTVNCVGVMGRGVALQYKNAFPTNYSAYTLACKRGEVVPGKMFVFRTGQLTPAYIINFPTKRHWRGKSRIEDIVSGLSDLVLTIREEGIRSIALPPLGSGLGGLDWKEVRPLIEDALNSLPDVHAIVYEPSTPGLDQMLNHREVPQMTKGRAALVELVQKYLASLLDPFVTLLEVHKLMYFMQEAGEELRLNFKKGPYGPYAENLRHVLRAIEGHFIAGYDDTGDKPGKQLTLVPGSVEEAQNFLASHEQTRRHFAKVVELAEGFESAFGLELLATVHWVMKHETYSTREEIVSHVHRWNDHKQQFNNRQICIAARILEEKGWIARGPGSAMTMSHVVR